MKLNVGCGQDPWGDVRLDVSSVCLRGKTTANIYADAENLPLRDKVFEETRAIHCIYFFLRLSKRKL